MPTLLVGSISAAGVGVGGALAARAEARFILPVLGLTESLGILRRLVSGRAITRDTSMIGLIMVQCFRLALRLVRGSGNSSSTH